MKSHMDLNAWKNSMSLVYVIYACTNSFPKHEQFGLTNQLRRAAVSVPSNISEGASRHSNAEFIRFLRISTGSLSEIETQLIIACHLGYLKEKELENLKSQIILIRAQIAGLIRKLSAG